MNRASDKHFPTYYFCQHSSIFVLTVSQKEEISFRDAKICMRFFGWFGFPILGNRHAEISGGYPDLVLVIILQLAKVEKNWTNDFRRSFGAPARPP